MKFLAVALVICSACASFAQDQEGQLMNRLLRPDMSLGNPIQNKKFLADKASIDRHARVSTFYLQKRPDIQTYTGARAFASHEYSAPKYDTRTSVSLLAARSTSPLRSYDTPPARASVELRDAHASVAGSSFAGNRPFLGKGKSQKFLDRKNKPMTIDDIRELLNKNK